MIDPHEGFAMHLHERKARPQAVTNLEIGLILAIIVMALTWIVSLNWRG